MRLNWWHFEYFLIVFSISMVSFWFCYGNVATYLFSLKSLFTNRALVARLSFFLSFIFFTFLPKNQHSSAPLTIFKDSSKILAASLPFEPIRLEPKFRRILPLA